MNKYLMLSAAAVLAGTAGANAGTHSFTFATAGGTAYCDGGTVATGVDGGALGGGVRAWVHSNNNCASGTSQGLGLLGKINTLGKTAVMSDTLEGKNYGSFTEQLSFTLPKKIHSGAAWTLWIGLSGFTAFEGNSGELINTTPARKGAVSTASVVKGLIQARMNGK
jgi:hypothetical protein